MRKLADGIIEAQVRGIAEMKRMIARPDARPTADGPRTFREISGMGMRPRHGFDLKPTRSERLG